MKFWFDRVSEYARVASAAPRNAEIDDAARGLVELARTHGYHRADLIRLIEDLT